MVKKRKDTATRKSPPAPRINSGQAKAAQQRRTSLMDVVITKQNKPSKIKTLSSIRENQMTDKPVPFFKKLFRQKQTEEPTRLANQTTPPKQNSAPNGCTIRSQLDELLELVNEKGLVTLKEVSSKFNIDHDLAEKWAKILEENKLIELLYPGMGEADLVKLGYEKSNELKSRGLSGFFHSSNPHKKRVSDQNHSKETKTKNKVRPAWPGKLSFFGFGRVKASQNPAKHKKEVRHGNRKHRKL